jgi:hypothetical protein
MVGTEADPTYRLNIEYLPAIASRSGEAGGSNMEYRTVEVLKTTRQYFLLRDSAVQELFKINLRHSYFGG